MSNTNPKRGLHCCSSKQRFCSPSVLTTESARPPSGSRLINHLFVELLG